MLEDAPSARIARTSAALVVALVPTAFVVSGFLGRSLLLLAGSAAVVCLAASVRLVRHDGDASVQASLLIAGAVCVIGGGAYLWSVRDVPAVIPIGGVLAVMLGLGLLGAGALVLWLGRSGRANP